MAEEITGYEDILDSRDIIERIEELEGLLDIGAEEVMPGTSRYYEDLRDELEMLQSIADQAAPYAPDWEYGTPLINADYWQKYAEELVKDIGDIPADLPSYIHICWETTAEALLVDYTPIEPKGRRSTYYVR